MRLDNFLTEKGLFDSRTKAKQAIERGEIFINGKQIKKCSFDAKLDANIEWICDNNFVSLGGFKLYKALNDFNFNVKDYVCADIGSSTGGFTDCLLKFGAKKVFSVDLNDELLHQSLKNNANVIPVIKNAKNLCRADFCNENIDLMVCDLSFISATMVLPVFSNVLNDGKHLLLLIKPQFENEQKRKYKNGIIRDYKIRKEACEKIFFCAIENGFTPTNLTNAPINEGKNVEYLALLKKGSYSIFDISTYNFKE